MVFYRLLSDLPFTGGTCIKIRKLHSWYPLSLPLYFAVVISHAVTVGPAWSAHDRRMALRTKHHESCRSIRTVISATGCSEAENKVRRRVAMIGDPNSEEKGAGVDT